MSANDDDDADGGDDAQLKQLRAVWVSMRDEDPPDRGLAALMNAAREKAGEMAAPEEGQTWWQRALAMLRRPPVLALATVTVLLGGALMLSQRKDQVTAESTVAVTQDRAKSSSREHADGQAPAGSSSLSVAPADTGAGSAAATAPPVVPPPVAEPVKTRPATIAAPTRPRPRPRPQTESPGTSGGRLEPTTDDKVLEQERSESVGGGGKAGIASGGFDADSPSPPPRPETDSTTTRGPVRKTPAPAMPDTAGETVSPRLSKDEDRAATITQLVKQCESAAARNDCAAVRVLAKRILSADAAAYKQRVVSNSTIARCLD